MQHANMKKKQFSHRNVAARSKTLRKGISQGGGAPEPHGHLGDRSAIVWEERELGVEKQPEPATTGRATKKNKKRPGASHSRQRPHPTPD